MSDDLFQEGGPYNVHRSGKDEYRMSIPMPTDDQGMTGRECVSETCSPGFFKVKVGTGIVEGQEIAYCPYCRTSADPSDFITSAQLEYAKSILANEAKKGIDRLVRKSFGLGRSGRKKMGGGLLSMEIRYKPGQLDPVRRPYEEELRRDVTCPECGLEHAVFGLATWCPDCASDIFLVHLTAEFEVIEKILDADTDRRARLGARIAARDIENSLEDTVSLFEAAMKFTTRRHLLEAGTDAEDVQGILDKKIRNGYQSIRRTNDLFKQYAGFDPFEHAEDADLEFLTAAFEKRHPITHNLGVIDRKYLQRASTGEIEGREIKLALEEVKQAARLSMEMVSWAYKKAFPGALS